MRTLLSLLLLSQLAVAAPPKLVVPSEVKPTGQYSIVKPDTDAVTVSYIGLDGIDPMPSELLKDARVFAIDTRGLKSGKYRFAAIGAGATGEQTRADFALVIEGPPVPPIPVPPTPVPVTVSQPLHILIVEETAQASADRGQLLSNTELFTRIKSKGHTFRCVDKDVKDTRSNPPATPADLAPYFKLTATYPTLFVVDNSGHVLYQGNVPGVSEILTLITKFGG